VNKNYHIIIVEEEEAVYESIVSALKKSGSNYHPRRVGTQEELDEELLRLAPDFVICDHSRSEWNSFAVLEQVRAFQPSMPFAVISGGMDESTHASLLANGVDACVDRDRLGELAPTVGLMLNRRAEQTRASVEEIRRNIISQVPLRRLGSRAPLQARTG
jgi:DNA-binding NarL/FixJ family response regulator